MQFQCDRCGKRYSTGQEIREGRAYRFKCRACGHDVIVRGPQGAAPGATTPAPPPARRNGNGEQPAGDLAPASPRPLTETPPLTVSVVNPDDAGPPPGGYLEFRLDSDVVTTQSTITAALTDAPGREITPPPSPFLALAPTPAPPTAVPPAASAFVPEPALDPGAGEPTPGLSGEARVGGAGMEPAAPRRRRLLVALVAVVPAVLVILLFGGLWGSGEGGKARTAREAAAPGKTPGLLTPQIYVGPVTFEAPTPQLEPSAAAPDRSARTAATPARPPPRREVAATRKPAAAARTASRTAEPAPAPSAPSATSATSAPPAASAAAPDAGPRTAAAQNIEPPAQEQAEPEAAEPQPAPAAAPAPSPAPAPAAATAAPVPIPPPPAGTSDEPVFAGTGFRRPTPVAPGCIERNVRIPQSLADRLPSSVLLRFAVGRDGSADLVQVQPGPDRSPNERIEPQLVQALTQAVRGCRFTPGADESGRLARLWVIMRVRFAE